MGNAGSASSSGGGWAAGFGSNTTVVGGVVLPESAVATVDASRYWVPGSSGSGTATGGSSSATLLSIDLSHQHITDVSTLPEKPSSSAAAALGTVVQLDLSFNQLKTLPPAIGHLTGLQVLRLSGCHLTGLPQQMARLARLRELDVSNNPLRDLSVCGTLRGLTQLTAACTDASEIPESVAVHGCLQELVMGENKLRAVPESLFLGSIKTCGHLTRLMLCGNEIEALPDTLGACASLTEINVSSNRLTSLPQSIIFLQDLQVLAAEKNRLTSVPDTIGLLQNLVSLSLAENCLRSLPHSFGEMRSLARLEVSGNQLTQLPPLPLGSLEELLVRNNLLQSLDASIRNGKRLQFLNLSFNRLSELPSSLGTLTQLEFLSIAANPLFDVDASILKLKCVNLSEVPIAQQVFPRLYLGNLDTALNKNFIQKRRITHVVNMAAGEPLALMSRTLVQHGFPAIPGVAETRESLAKACVDSSPYCVFPHLTYHMMHLIDSSSSDIISHLDSAVSFIRAALTAAPTNNVLVHCHQGVSRSATVCAAFLVRSELMTADDAMARIAAARPCIRSKFLAQVAQYQRRVFLERLALRRDTQAQSGVAIPPRSLPFMAPSKLVAYDLAQVVGVVSSMLASMNKSASTQDRCLRCGVLTSSKPCGVCVCCNVMLCSSCANMRGVLDLAADQVVPVCTHCFRMSRKIVRENEEPESGPATATH